MEDKSQSQSLNPRLSKIREEERKADLASPLFKPLNAMMDVDLVVNENGDVWILHDKPLPDLLDWVEYDRDDAALILVSNGGKMQDLGMVIHPPIEQYMQYAMEINVVQLRDGKMHDFYHLPLIIRDTAIH